MFVQADSSKNLPFRPGSCTLVYADPPTNRGMNEGNSCDTLPFPDYLNFTKQWLNQACNLMATDSWLVICLYHKLRHQIEHLIHDYKGHTPVFDHEIIWDYNFGLYTKSRFVPSHDNILVFKQGKPKFYWQEVSVESQRQRSNDPRADQRGRTPSSVWSIPRVPGNAKTRSYIDDTYRRSSQPVALCNRILRAFTKENDRVIDLFSGSGTMTCCAHLLGRRAIGVDICFEYLQESQQRLKKEPEREFMTL